MADLKTVIAKLASDLAAEVVAAVRHMSLSELADLGSPRPRLGRPRKAHAARRSPGRPKHVATAASRGATTRHRRSPEQLQKVADQIVTIVRAHPKGVNAEDIKTQMGIKHGNVGAKVFTKPLGVALASKKITKRGNKRGTMYFAA